MWHFFCECLGVLLSLLVLRVGCGILLYSAWSLPTLILYEQSLSIQVVKILQEPKAYLKHQKKRRTNNKITDDMPSKQLFPKQVATRLTKLCYGNVLKTLLKTYSNVIIKRLHSVKMAIFYVIKTFFKSYQNVLTTF